ncbi:unnamed protein product [Paramecium primaurelia]|uniref:Uncharacterized protein n=1 Tax=Paramecium primaurelia TaxID=5886 RepID=A0A8S1N5J0_PARPR|nr:unnamed protein product [Paramecium primaurelia]
MKSPKSNGSSNNKFTISEFGYYKQCSRFLPTERASEFSTQDAIIYDRLRQAGMKRNQALKFCKGQHCKIDSTQQKHGPPGFKIFNTKIDKLKQLNGWQMVGRLNYEQSMREEYSNDSEWQIQDQNKEEQEKMEQLKQFYTDLDLKYSFNEMDSQETLTKLRSLSTEQQYRSRVPQYQLKDVKNKMMYYEMAEYILQLKKPPNTLIQDLNVFDDTIPLVRQEYFDIQPKYIEKATPFYPKQNCEKRSKLLKELTRAYTGNITITEPAEEIKKVSQFLQFWLLDFLTNQILIIVIMLRDLNSKHQMNLFSQVQMILINKVPRRQNKDVVQ